MLLYLFFRHLSCEEFHDGVYKTQITLTNHTSFIDSYFINISDSAISCNGYFSEYSLKVLRCTFYSCKSYGIYITSNVIAYVKKTCFMNCNKSSSIEGSCIYYNPQQEVSINTDNEDAYFDQIQISSCTNSVLSFNEKFLLSGKSNINGFPLSLINISNCQTEQSGYIINFKTLHVFNHFTFYGN